MATFKPYQAKKLADIADFPIKSGQVFFLKEDKQIYFDDSEGNRMAATINVDDTREPVVIMTANDNFASLEANKLYIFPEMEALGISLIPPANESITNRYHFIFKAPSAKPTTFSMPVSIARPMGLDIVEGGIYEVEIIDNNLFYQACGSADQGTTTTSTSDGLTASDRTKLDNLDAIIAAKGYQTQAQVKSAIETYGYVTQNQLANAMINSGHLQRKVVTALPSVDDADEEVIYMIKPSGKDYYEEYFLINGVFDIIGSSTADLSDYVKKGDLQNYALRSDIPNALPASDVSAWAKADTKPTYEYSEILNIPDIPTNTSHLTNDSGFAVNNATDPFVTNSVLESLKTELASTYAKPSDIPTSLPASDVYAWAKAETKPEYDYSEIKNTPKITDSGVAKNTSDLNNDSGFITNDALNGYATEDWVTLTAKAASAISADTVDWSGVQNAPTSLPASDVAAWAKALTKPQYTYGEILETPTIPTTTSELTNDSGFLTEHQSLAGYLPFKDSYIGDANSWLTNGYTKTNTSTTNLPALCTGAGRWGILFFIAENAKDGTGTQMYFPIDETYVGRIFTRSMLKKVGKPWYLLATNNDIPTLLSQLTNDSGFITEEAISSLAKTDDIPTKISDLTNDSSFLTEHQSLDGYVEKSRTINNKSLESDISLTASDVGAIPTTSIGVASGVAELDENGKVPLNQIPLSLEDVIEASSVDGFPTTGSSGTIYIDTTTNITYRWTGSTYTKIGGSVGDVSSLQLGTTSETAGRGDWTKVAYDYSQEAHAPVEAEKNVVVGAQVNGQDIAIVNRKLQITVPTKTSDIANDSDFITSSALNGLAKSSDIPTTLPASDVYDWAKEENKPSYSYGEISDVPTIPTVPTNISAFTNDAGYLTEHQDISGKVDKALIVNGTVTGQVGNSYTGVSDIELTSDIINDLKSGRMVYLYILDTYLPPFDYMANGVMFSGWYGTMLLQASWQGTKLTATLVNIPSKTSDLDNNSGYITSSDLSGYAKSSDIPTKISAFTNDSNYITNSALDPYALKTDVPSNTSDLTNDSGFITSSAIPTSLPASDVSAWAKATSKPSYSYSEIQNTPTIPTATSQLTNDSNFVTTTQLNSKQDTLITGNGLQIVNGVISLTFNPVRIYNGVQDASTGNDGDLYVVFDE